MRFALAAVVAIAGCTPAVVPPTPPPAAPVVVDDESRQVAELLGYYQRVAQLGPEDQKRELATATQGFNRERTATTRVRLALLYALPGTAFQDDGRAVQLLEPVAGGAGTLRSLANLMNAQVSERMKVQKRADQLKDQVEALRAIEKELLDRGQQPTPRKP